MGILGIIQNFEQLKKTNESVNDFPAIYPNMLERELEYWKKLSKDFIDSNYDFISDRKEILATLPDKLTKKSIHKFIHYTLYELSLISNGWMMWLWIISENSWRIFIIITH